MNLNIKDDGDRSSSSSFVVSILGQVKGDECIEFEINKKLFL